jgi:hypothetical protein
MRGQQAREFIDDRRQGAQPALASQHTQEATDGLASAQPLGHGINGPYMLFAADDRARQEPTEIVALQDHLLQRGEIGARLLESTALLSKVE